MSVDAVSKFIRNEDNSIISFVYFLNAFRNHMGR